MPGPLAFYLHSVAIIPIIASYLLLLTHIFNVNWN